VIGLEPLEALLELLHGALGVPGAHLGHQEDLVPVPALERVPHARLAQAVVVLPGVVEEVDPLVDGAPHDPLGFLARGGDADVVAAEPEDRDLGAGLAEGAVGDPVPLLDRLGRPQGQLALPGAWPPDGGSAAAASPVDAAATPAAESLMKCLRVKWCSLMMASCSGSGCRDSRSLYASGAESISPGMLPDEHLRARLGRHALVRREDCRGSSGDPRRGRSAAAGPPPAAAAPRGGAPPPRGSAELLAGESRRRSGPRAPRPGPRVAGGRHGARARGRAPSPAR
jgi:hypothetical protein